MAGQLNTLLKKHIAYLLLVGAHCMYYQTQRVKLDRGRPSIYEDDQAELWLCLLFVSASYLLNLCICSVQ